MNLTHKKIVFFYGVVFYFFTAANAQPLKRFYSQTYTVNNGLLVNQVVDMIEDPSGFMWISTGAGLQRFDGSKFETINANAGLPETNHPLFFKLRNGIIWLSYYHGISAYNSSTNKFNIVYRNHNLSPTKTLFQQYEIAPIIPLSEVNDLIWCWSGATHLFIGINKYSYKVVDSFHMRDHSITDSKKIKTSGQRIFFLDQGSILSVDFVEKNLKLIYKIPGTTARFFDFCPIKKRLILIDDHGISEVNGEIGKPALVSKFPENFNHSSVEQTSIYNLTNNLLVISANNELYTFDIDKEKFLYHMINLQNSKFVEYGYISFETLDHFGHLWVASNAEGIRKLNFTNADIKYYGKRDLQNNFSRCIYPDKKNNLVLVGKISNELSLFDTTGKLIKEFSFFPHSASAQISAILKVEARKYLIFCRGKYSCYLLDAEDLTITPVLKKPPIDYYATITPLSNDSAFLFCSTEISIIKYKNRRIQYIPIRKNLYCLSSLLDHKKRIWVGALGRYSILSGKNFEKEDNFFLKENVLTKCFYQGRDGVVWMGTEKGLYKLDSTSGSILHVYRKQDGLANETIYSIIEDNNGNIWCSTNLGLSCIHPNGRTSNLYVLDGLQSNEFNMNCCVKADDGELFFGGTNGVNSFYPQNIRFQSEELQVILTSLKIMEADRFGDTAAWNIKSVTVPYTDNILSFSFTALGWYAPNRYNYQYKMKGIDKHWVNSGNEGYARYNLSPGRYVFEYAAAQQFEQNPIGKKYLIITVTPPFWKKTWFIIITVLFCLMLMIFAVTSFNTIQKRKFLRKAELQNIIQQERARISRDLHDNVGAYTTALVSSAERLNKIAADLGFKQTTANVSQNARNILNALHETIWVLNNSSITITDFSDRLKLYAKKIGQSYPLTNIKFHEEIQNDFELSPAEALHLFRIMQEVLQNALKHGNPNHIFVTIKTGITIFISVKDDGKGFDRSSVVSGNGLLNMECRAEEIGYHIQFLSTASGTEVRLNKK